MSRRLFCFAALAFAALAVTGPGPAVAQDREYPRLRAALHELRDARGELREARDAWPPGYRDRALEAIDDAIKSLKTILAVRDERDFRGVDRDPDFYKRYKDYPRLRAALSDLREARDELRAAKADFGGLKERAVDDIDIAIGHVAALVRQRR